MYHPHISQSSNDKYGYHVVMHQTHFQWMFKSQLEYCRVKTLKANFTKQYTGLFEAAKAQASTELHFPTFQQGRLISPQSCIEYGVR